MEPLISVAFKYPEDLQHAELIVRVPQLLVQYKGDQKKLKEIRKDFSELFNFYEERILKALEIEHPLIRMRCHLKGLNAIFNYSFLVNDEELLLKKEALALTFDETKSMVVKSNCLAVTMIGIHQLVKHEENFEEKFM